MLFMSKLVIMLNEDFFQSTFNSQFHDIEKAKTILNREYKNLKHLKKSLCEGFYLSQRETLKVPDSLPHIISEWPLLYNYSPKSHPYGNAKVGIVKFKD